MQIAISHKHEIYFILIIVPVIVQRLIDTCIMEGFHDLIHSKCFKHSSFEKGPLKCITAFDSAQVHSKSCIEKIHFRPLHDPFRN